MAPNGNIYFHPRSLAYRDDFSVAETYLKGLFIHEMTHVWQHQGGTNVRKAIFNRRYRYRLVRGKAFRRYGLERSEERRVGKGGGAWTSRGRVKHIVT